MPKEFAPDDPGIRRVQTISKGEKKISIEFPGTDIYRKRLNFPCFLLLDLIDSNEKTNSTILRLEGEYTYNNFESPFPCGFYDFIEHGGSVTNTGGSIGADTDKNDLYDLLEIKLSAFTKVPGNYSVVGDTGLAWGHYACTTKQKDGPQRTIYLRYAHTFAKRDGKWRLVMYHRSLMTSEDMQ